MLRRERLNRNNFSIHLVDNLYILLIRTNSFRVPNEYKHLVVGLNVK